MKLLEGEGVPPPSPGPAPPSYLGLFDFSKMHTESRAKRPDRNKKVHLRLKLRHPTVDNLEAGIKGIITKAN